MTSPVPRAATVDRDAVGDAAARIAGRVRRTPVIEVEAEAFGTPDPLVLKLELFQHTGSFKPRGAFNRVLRAGSPELLVAASGGNHGLAVAFVAQRLGLRAEVFVPASAPAVKVEGIRALGADVTLVGSSYAEAYEASADRARTSGALAVHAYDHEDVLAGQGTVGLELEQQLAQVGPGGIDTLLVATGGGGLIGGIAAWWSGRTRIVSVEPVGAPTLHDAIASGRPVDVDVWGPAVDALGARRVGELGFAIAQEADVVPLLVDGEAIAAARSLLWSRLRVAAEPGGATALAALTSGAYVPAAGERVAVVVCGANASPADLV